MKRTLAVLAIGATALLAFASPASAATVCPTWKLQSIVTEWGDPADGSKIVDGGTVVLTKPAGGGTEFATADAGIVLETPADITVTYELDDEADFTAGAVRLFYYDTADADTLTTAPTAFVAADAKSGTLTIPDVTTIGTLGLVYDASNSASGSVTFTDLKVGDNTVSFTDGACKPASPSPAPSSASPTTPAGGGGATSSPTPPAAGAAGGLPVTGVGLPLLVGVGMGLAGVGVVAELLARRRRVRFTAE